MNEPRIWHSKRPLYIGGIALLILVVGGLLIAQAAKPERVEAPVAIEPDETDNLSTEDPYDDEEAVADLKVDDSSLTLSLGETGKSGDLLITPRSIVEDSRCPGDVQCIQAGRMVVSVEVVRGDFSDSIEIEEGQSREVGGITLTLSEVTPEPVSTKLISENDYRFTFSITE